MVMKRTSIFLSIFVFVFMMICAIGNCRAYDYILSTDFDLIEGTSGSKHSVRIYAITPGVTTIKIDSISPFDGTPDIEETVSDSDGYKDWSLLAGSTITTDNPVAVIKYDVSSYSWDTQLLGYGKSFTLSNSEFFLAIAGE